MVLDGLRNSLPVLRSDCQPLVIGHGLPKSVGFQPWSTPFLTPAVTAARVAAVAAGCCSVLVPGKSTGHRTIRRVMRICAAAMPIVPIELLGSVGSPRPHVLHL